jgi:PhnB protein
MAKNPPEGTQRVIPYLNYADVPAAIDFLCAAFGFERRIVLPMPDGRVGHAELALGNNVLMLASVFEEMGHKTPAQLGAHHGAVMCYVHDVDSHHDRALAAGATITQGLEDKFYGDRMYACVDPEGHHWHFGMHVRDVSQAEMIEAMKQSE